MIALGQEVRVVVAHERQVQLTGQLDDERVDSLLLRRVVPLQLQKEARLAVVAGLERGDVPPCLLDGGLVVRLVAGGDELREVVGDRAAEVAVDRDEPVGPLRQRLLVHARLVVEAVQERVGAELDEVGPALVVLGEQHQVKAAVREARGRAIAAVARGDVGLDAEDRLDAGGPRPRVELDGPVQVAVVGHRHGVHAQLLDAAHQPVDPVGSVEQRVLRVQMQVGEARLVHMLGVPTV